MEIVTQHLRDFIAKQVEDYKLVVCYDPNFAYSGAVDENRLTLIEFLEGECRTPIDCAWLSQAMPPLLCDGPIIARIYGINTIFMFVVGPGLYNLGRCVR